MNEAYNIDCMEFMRRVPSKYFDLAVVDPPYGIEKGFKETSRVRRYGQTKTANDDKPTAEYFTELFRVSKNQIIWGYNHLSDLLPPTKEFIFWYKRQPVDSYSDGELAWTSFNKTAKCFDHAYFGNVGADDVRIHPMQKPVALYLWLYAKYAHPYDKIFDSHLGSGSSRIAAYDMALDFIGCGRTVKPVTFSVLGKDGKDKAVRGTVSYIHPARRYCILEFAVRGGILRESFQLIDGEIAE